MKHSTWIAALALAASSSMALEAQPGRWREDWGPSRHNNGGSYSSITRTINDCENRTDDFRRSLRRALNASPLDHTGREHQLLRQADRLENALDRTGDSWNRDRDPRRARRYVAEALDAARDIDTTMRRWRLHPEADRDWSIVRAQLAHLARALDLSGGRW